MSGPSYELFLEGYLDVAARMAGGRRHQFTIDAKDRLLRGTQEFYEKYSHLFKHLEREAGQHFYLTRNREGDGFWNVDWPENTDKILTDASHAAGETPALQLRKGRIGLL